ncbi:hypothetical protein NP233_g5339 [Leucocoprinus birnbaumii]|uniref:Uncharacterized protein n=1 Tax=Leucocoprinus birnbaumii TaxID=56174 RepID=A0AAD5VVN8_9AGAR|nr:hypothetical protein NP233_g5339 [Leucocoprinus birnbaumii]
MRSTRATPNSTQHRGATMAKQSPETPIRQHEAKRRPQRSSPATPKQQPTSAPAAATAPTANNQSAAAVPKPATQGYRLRQSDVPEGAKGIKRALELHIRILWGMIDANAVPPTPQPSHVAAFKAHFSESATDTDLQRACNGEQLIESNLVEIGSLISPATQKQIASAVKNVEEFILRFVQTFISRFGLIRWCPDFDQSPYSLYNSACRLIALNTFNQAVVSHAYDSLRPNTKYLTNTDMLIKLYDHFVHHRMYEVFKRELRVPGSAQALSDANPQHQSRLRLANARRAFLKQNKYPKRYLSLITPKATSDDERDPDGKFEDKRPVFLVKQRPERSEAMNRFIRLLEEKRDEGFRFGGQRRERIRKVPSEPQETAFFSSNLIHERIEPINEKTECQVSCYCRE